VTGIEPNVQRRVTGYSLVFFSEIGSYFDAVKELNRWLAKMARQIYGKIRTIN
jgi:hypothetical protein